MLSTPEYIINHLGYVHLRADENEEAIKVFKENVKRYPNSANVYDSLAEAYEKNEDYKNAKENYKKAYDIAVSQEDRFVLYFKGNLDRMTKKLEK